MCARINVSVITMCYMCVCDVCVHLFVLVSTSMCVYMSLYIYMSIRLHMPIYVSVCLHIDISIMSMCIYVCIYVPFVTSINAYARIRT
jgi:hypothetical protein